MLTLTPNPKQEFDLNPSSSEVMELETNALAVSYNERIRPLLDAVDRLRQLKITKEGIQLPTIVVVGDQSSGKSSVLESLAGISLPRGQGICTRVPLIMSLQNDPNAVAPLLELKYGDKTVPTSEAGVASAINVATVEIAGDNKGISSSPITLVVKKRGVPDLTLVDLPGITRVPIQGQPEDIYEQIANIINEYITPKESIILNVLSATVDFPTCESIRMSQKVDNNGERTLAVVTKVDKAPEGLVEKVTVDDVKIGLGYVCVRNRIGDETYEEARAVEARLFESHPLLSIIDKSMVGIPVLAQQLTDIQASIIARCLPDIVKKINDMLGRNMTELNNMPRNFSTTADALTEFIRILKKVRVSLEMLLVRGEYVEFPDNQKLHGYARVAQMVHKYSKSLPSDCPTAEQLLFLMEEISVLGEAKGIHLPNFLPRSAFLTLLRKKLQTVSHMPRDFVNEVLDYLEDMVIVILTHHSENYPQLKLLGTRAVHSLIEKTRVSSSQFVEEMIKMELNADYTFNPDYLKTCTCLMKEQGKLVDAINDYKTNVQLDGLGLVDVEHLRNQKELVEQAFDMRVRLVAYWKSIILRLVDGVALHVTYRIKCLVEKELEAALVEELVGPQMDGIQKMMEESPATASKRDRLDKSIELLKKSKEVVAGVMDRVSIGSN
ncbi:hypothetical protein LUZ60_009604 [Juncus effusus]|nr:hypothetical protein LUZ60_009604 [Juncus effusus]